MYVLRSWAISELFESLVSPCWASPFWQTPQKEPKSLAPASGPGCAGIRSLHRRSEGRRTRAIHADGGPDPLRLSPHPCGSPLYATIALTLLMGRMELPDSSFEIKAKAGRKPPGRSDFVPVRRPSGRRAQGREAGRRARTDGLGRLSMDAPFVTTATPVVAVSPPQAAEA